MAIKPEQQSQIDEVRLHAKAYLEAENFFHGHVEEIYASPKVRQMLQKSGLDNLDAINFSKIPCNALLNRLEIKSVTAKAAEGGADLTEQVKAIWDRNLMGFFAPDAHRKASSLGDSYVFVWPVTDDNDKVINVDIRINGPMTTRVFYHPEDPLLKESAVKVWTYHLAEGKPESRANFYYPDRIERYVTDKDKNGNGTKTEDWVRYQSPKETIEGKDWLIQNPWDEVPIFHHRTDFPYGIPDNHDAWVPQIMINKLVISHASTIDFQNFPQRYFLMDPQDDNTMGGADSDADFPEDSDNDPESPYNRSRFRADPGEIWVATAKQAGQFQAADSDTFIKPFNRYVLSIAQVTETPLHEFEPGGQAPSGESRKVLEAPLIKRCNMRKLLAGSTWKDVYQFALELMGHEGAIVVVNWLNSASDPGPEDWQIAEKKIAMGVPARVVLAEMGYEEDVMADWHDGHAEPDDLAYGVVTIDERRAQIGLPPLPNGEGNVRVQAPAGNAPTMDPHTARLLAEANGTGVIGDGQGAPVPPGSNGNGNGQPAIGVHGG